jgi:hypothetical protein
MHSAGRWLSALAIMAAIWLTGCRGSGAGGDGPSPTSASLSITVTFNAGTSGIQCTGDVAISYIPSNVASGGPGTIHRQFGGLSGADGHCAPVIDLQTNLAFGTWSIRVNNIDNCQRQLSVQAPNAHATFDVHGAVCSS